MGRTGMLPARKAIAPPVHDEYFFAFSSSAAVQGTARIDVITDPKMKMHDSTIIARSACSSAVNMRS